MTMEFDRLNGFSRLCDIVRNGILVIIHLCGQAEHAPDPRPHIARIRHRCETMERDLARMGREREENG